MSSNQNRFAAMGMAQPSSTQNKKGKKKNRKSNDADAEEALLNSQQQPESDAPRVGQPNISQDDFTTGNSVHSNPKNEESKNNLLISEESRETADQNFEMMVGKDKFSTAQKAAQQAQIEQEQQFDSEEEDSDEIAEDSNEVIKIVNVHKTYLLGIEGVPALRGVNLTVHDGEFISILGTSGGGKTTLLNIIGTIDKPSKGDVYICGLRIKFSTKDTLLASIRLNKLGFVFQTFNLIGSLTALENVELPMQLQGKLSREEIRQRARQLLKDVGLETRMDHFPNMLSGGEQQRVTIARSIANKPKILLLDEPTGDLDTRSTDIVMKILIDLNIREKITMIMVTHDVALKNFAHRVVKMADGKVNRIIDIDPKARQGLIQELSKRVDDIHAGNDKGHLMIREGIFQSEAQKKQPIPENYRAVLDPNNASKTSVRRTKDYPVLGARFQQS